MPDRKLAQSFRSLRLQILDDRIVPNAGTLDPFFATGGMLTTSVGEGHASANAVAVGPGGKIAVAGRGQDSGGVNIFAVACYNADGTLDTSFDTDGKVTTGLSSFGSLAYGVAFQPDGKIVAVGYSNEIGAQDFAILRYNANGSLDSTFGTGGIVFTDYGQKRDIATCVTVQSDGKIVVGGTIVRNSSDYDHFAVARYESDGKLDSSFGTDGITVSPISAIGDYAYGVAIDSAGNIALAGNATYDNEGAWSSQFAVAKFLPSGILDAAFSSDGIVTIHVTNDDYGRDVAFQADGKIIIAGYSANGIIPATFTMVRYNTDGTVDTAFQGGSVRTSIGAGSAEAQTIAIQANGKIVVAGNDGPNSGFTVARYNTDGTLDTGFGIGGTQIVPFTSQTAFTNSMGKSMAIQPDGQIVVAGHYWDSENYYQKFGLARFNANSLPPTVTSVVFGDGGLHRSTVKRIVVNFSEAVNFTPDVASAFTLTRVGSVGNVALTASPATGPASSVTITFSGDYAEHDSLIDGFYDLTISPAQVSGKGGALDGNNDYIAGGAHFTQGTTANKFFRLFGDSDGDSATNLLDFAALRDVFQVNHSDVFDFDNDDSVGLLDFAAFRDRFNVTL